MYSAIHLLKEIYFPKENKEKSEGSKSLSALAIIIINLQSNQIYLRIAKNIITSAQPFEKLRCAFTMKLRKLEFIFHILRYLE